MFLALGLIDSLGSSFQHKDHMALNPRPEWIGCKRSEGRMWKIQYSSMIKRVTYSIIFASSCHHCFTRDWNARIKADNNICVTNQNIGTGHGCNIIYSHLHMSKITVKENISLYQCHKDNFLSYNNIKDHNANLGKTSVEKKHQKKLTYYQEWEKKIKNMIANMDNGDRYASSVIYINIYRIDGFSDCQLASYNSENTSCLELLFHVTIYDTIYTRFIYLDIIIYIYVVMCFWTSLHSLWKCFRW